MPIFFVSFSNQKQIFMDDPLCGFFVATENDIDVLGIVGFQNKGNGVGELRRM